MRKIVLLGTLALFCAGFGWSVTQQESVRATGTVMYLQLAPKDPRALLLGDYMITDFFMSRQVRNAVYAAHGEEGRDEPGYRKFMTAPVATGRAVVAVDGLGSKTPGLARFVRLDDGSPLQPGEHFLVYRVENGRARVGASAFFFQEGHAQDYERASYGKMLVSRQGQSLLVGMCTDDLHRIRPGMQNVEK